MADNQSNQTTFEIEKNINWYTTTILLILIIILSTLGNLMVLAATWIERSLHQPSKYFIASLAIADLLVGIFSAPLFLYQHSNSPAITSIYLCRFFIWIDIFAESASINTLTFISFDRYLKISKPLRYKTIMTTSKSLIVIFTVWLISTAFATFGMFPYAGSAGIYISLNQGCVSDNIVFYTFAAVISFFVPTFITLVMYTSIFFVAHKRRKMVRNGDLGETYDVGNMPSTLLQDLKNIRMLAVVMGTFVICWGPFFVFSMLLNHHRISPDDISSRIDPVLVIQSLPRLNSVCNPIIYACLDRRYRQAFKLLFRRLLCQSTSRNTQSLHALGIRR